MVALDGSVFDGAVHPHDLAVGSAWSIDARAMLAADVVAP